MLLNTLRKNKYQGKNNNILHEYHLLFFIYFREGRKTSCSLSSELSIDEAYILDHLSTLLEQKGLICADGEWPIFGNDDEEDSRSLTDQLLDIKPLIKSKDIKVETSEKGKI